MSDCFNRIPSAYRQFLAEEHIVDEVQSVPEEDKMSKPKFYLVSEEAFNRWLAYMTSQNTDIKRCSNDEVQKINETIGSQFKVNEIGFIGDMMCNKCTRVINFYDFFKKAYEHHHSAFMTWALLDEVKKIHLFPHVFDQKVWCSTCGEFLQDGQPMQFFTDRYIRLDITNRLME